MEETIKERKELYKKFQELFPIEFLKNMPLEKYTNLKNVDGEESFCYWIEHKTRPLGSMKGGNSYKFGIYKYIKGKRPQDTTMQSDDTYAWYKWYNKSTAQDAYEFVRDAVVRIAELASKGKFEDIEKIDVFGDGFKWKIAYLYSNETLIPIYKRVWLDLIAKELGMENPEAKRILDIQYFLMQQRAGQDIYEYHDKLYSIVESHNNHSTFNKEFKTAIRNLLKKKGILKTGHSDGDYIWVGTIDGKILSDDCHFELCWDGTKKAGHDGKTIFVELHCEEKKTAKKFESLKNIEGVSKFPWGSGCLGIRINNDGWKISDYTVEELADVLVEELYKLNDIVGEQVKLIESQINQLSSVSFSPSGNQSTKGMKYQNYINLLKEAHNLVLTGAPGTGKTFMAQAIASEMGAETEFVQFHPSYDYTDFVEGLRPVDVVKESNVIGFKRKNGVFKDFCAKAIENLKESSFESLYETIVEDISNGSIKEYTTLTGIVYPLKVIDGIIKYGCKNNGSEFKSENIENIKLIYQHYLNNPQEIDYSTEGLRNLISKLTNGAITTLDPAEYTWTIKELLTRRSNTYKKYVFIIDEINRGEASKIFGELFYAIDPGYRGKMDILVQTQYQNLVPETDVFAKGFYVPENVYILATMNDIDRSVESMDFAMRRRFTWHEITPNDTESMLDTLPCAEEAKERMHRLNNAIAETDGLGAAYMIGPAYFLKLDKNGGDFKKLWKMNIQPLLREYLRGFRKTEEILEEFSNAYFGKTKETATGSSLLEDEN